MPRVTFRQGDETRATMRLHCPHCGASLRLPVADGGDSLPNAAPEQLRGGERECRDCDGRFSVYHY